MDKVKLNTAFNTLKAAVGENGGFVLLCVSQEGEHQEDRNILSSGPLIMNLGILGSMVPILQDKLTKRLKEAMKDGLRQPD